MAKITIPEIETKKYALNSPKVESYGTSINYKINASYSPIGKGYRGYNLRL